MSQVDSRTILDTGGAEKMLGNGDMLYKPVGVNNPVRVQGTFVRSGEIHAVIDFLKKHSGADYDDAMIAEMEKRNVEKAKILYDYLDESALFHNPVRPCDRSLMNVTFVTGDAEMDAKAVAYTQAAGFENLKGHRSVGGLRASIYNAMPKEGVEALVEFLKKFEAENT